jgi:hypothetical protein
MDMSFDDEGHPVDDPTNGLYGYVDVVIPQGALGLCATKLNPPDGYGLRYAIRLKLDDLGGSQSTLKWSHCTMKEFPMYISVDNCQLGTPSWGGGGQVGADNTYQDEISFNPGQQNGSYCEFDFVTDWRISSDASTASDPTQANWYSVETATYQNTYVVVNGQPTMDMKRNGRSIFGQGAFPACQ